MACTSKPERRRWKREGIAYAKKYKQKLAHFRVGATVKSCGGLGVVMRMEGPYRPHYMMYGRYYMEYDLEIYFADDGSTSWHGLVDCSEIP